MRRTSRPSKRHAAPPAAADPDRSYESLSKLLDATPDFVVIHRDGVILYANPASIHALGHERLDEVTGKPVLEIVHPDDREAVITRMKTVAAGGTAPPREERMICAGGEIRWFEVTAHAISFHGGRAVMAVGRETTEKRAAAEARAAAVLAESRAAAAEAANRVLQTEVEKAQLAAERNALVAQLRQSQKLEIAGTLASSVAHEINNPLMGIMGFAQLIQQRSESPGCRKYAGEIMGEAQRAAEIVRNLLGFVHRDDAEAIMPTPVETLVVDAMKLAAGLLRADGITVEIENLSPGAMAACRPKQIRQVLLNLLVNARDAINERPAADGFKAVVRVQTQAHDADGLPWVRIAVTDTGVGIRKEHVAHIFEPFFTTKESGRGTGLGLPICARIVREHNGLIHVRSTYGEGSTFTIDLPRQEPGSFGLAVPAALG